jgi:hypothetical protein
VTQLTQVTDPVAFPVTRIAAPAVSAVSPAAAPVAATVNRTVAPLVSTLDRTVAAVDGPVASATHRLPRLPRPAVKPPQLPNPDVPVATVRKPPPAVVSTVPRSPVAEARRPVPDHPSGKVHPPRTAAVSGTAEASSPAPASALSGTATPAPSPSNLASVQNIDSPLKTLAQLKITASTRPLARAIQAPAQGPLHEHPATERLNIAATHGEPGSGSDSSPSHTADIAASWNGLSPAASALAAGATVIPPSGPSADPGSSPD